MASPTLTRVLAPAASYDLTDLVAAKDELRISATDVTKDTFLARAITQISAAVASYCARVFPVETVQDVFDYPISDYLTYQHRHGDRRGHASEQFKLSRWPIACEPVTLPAAGAAAGATTLAFATTAGVTIGLPVAHLSVPDGAVVTAVTPTTVTLSAELTADVLAGSSVVFGMCITTGEPSSRAIIAPDEFEIDARAGILRWRNRSAALALTISYAGGFKTVPDDLEMAVLRAIVGRYAGRGRDPMLRTMNQPMQGQQDYWVGTTPGQRGGFTSEIADILDTFAER
jgi:hypothetical protein